MPPTDEDPDRIAGNLRRQRALYGSPLGERTARLTSALRISQRRLAQALGLSPAMLSQLASGRRCTVSDPDVLARLQLLDARCRELTGPPEPAAVGDLLAEVERTRWCWSTPTARPTAPAPPLAAPLAPPLAPPPARRPDPAPAVDALRGLAPPHRLAAAASVLAPGFPELAELLRRAAARG